MRVAMPLVLFLALASAACAPAVDLKQSLQVSEVVSGWQDAGIVDGKNKLVPRVSFRLTNQSAESLPVLQINALFKRQGEQDEWGSGFLTIVGSEGLDPGASTEVVHVVSNLGYTGTEPRAEMLKNQYFVDARVELFAKYGATQWVLVGEYPITRELLTQ